MERLEIEFSGKAAKDYKKLPRDYKKLVDSVLDRFSEGLPVDIKPVTGAADVYRTRVGKYRVLLTVMGRTVIIARIRPRGEAYK